MDIRQLFASLRQEAECPLCLGTVKGPKTLPCLHSFCLTCLDKHTEFARKQLQTTIKCPVCQTSFQIPEGDSFKNLPTSYHLNRLVDVLALKGGSEQAQKCSSCDENNNASCFCFECQNFLCTACVKAHQRLKSSRGHRSVMIEKLQERDVEELIHRPVMCSQQYHENQPLEFYCDECKVLICHKCSVVSHNQHTMTDIQKASQFQTMQMAEALKKVKAETVIYENETKKQNVLMDKAKNDVLSGKKMMADVVQECICNLRQHERAMKAKFTEICEAQQKHNIALLENFEVALAQMKSCVEQGKKILERNVSAEILQTNQIIVERCEELLNSKTPEIHEPPLVRYILENKLNILDCIVVSDTDPSLSLVKMESNIEVLGNTEANFTIVTRDFRGLKYYQEDDQIRVHISTSAGDELETEIKDTKDGKYTVTYTPQCVGQHRVEIQVNGQPLTGSPWVVQVIPHHYQFTFQFGSHGKDQGKFNSLRDIALSHQSRTLAVADVENMRIQMFTLEGNFLREITLENEPCSLAFTKTGDLLVSIPYDHNKLSLYTEGGQFIRYISNEHVKKPWYISVATDGRIITSDKGDNTIKVLSPDGKYLTQSFSAPSCDAEPRCIVYHQDKFFVSYTEAHRLVVFNSAGDYLYDIGSKGSGAGQMTGPWGLVFDKFDRLIVCDAVNRRLILFTPDGKFVAEVAETSPKYGFLTFCAVSNTGHLFVTDVEKNCIHVFH